MADQLALRLARRGPRLGVDDLEGTRFDVVERLGWVVGTVDECVQSHLFGLFGRQEGIKLRV